MKLKSIWTKEKMPFIKKIIFTLSLFIFFSINLSVNAQSAQIKSGNTAPTFVLKSLEDNYVYLRDFCGKLRPPSKNKKQHVVIVSFFATWCKPCLKEIKELKMVLANFEGRNLQLFLIDLKEEKSVVRKFVREKNLPGTILLDKYGVVAKKYGATTLPRLFVIDRDGKLVWETKGYHENLADELTSVLEKLL